MPHADRGNLCRTISSKGILEASGLDVATGIALINGNILAAADGPNVLYATVPPKWPLEEKTTNSEIKYQNDIL